MYVWDRARERKRPFLNISRVDFQMGHEEFCHFRNVIQSTLVKLPDDYQLVLPWCLFFFLLWGNTWKNINIWYNFDASEKNWYSVEGITFQAQSRGYSVNMLTFLQTTDTSKDGVVNIWGKFCFCAEQKKPLLAMVEPSPSVTVAITAGIWRQTEERLKIPPKQTFSFNWSGALQKLI